MSFFGSVGFSAAALFLAAAPQGPASFCDPNLVKDTKSSMSYQMRGDRCEGIYAQQVGTVSLDLRSFVKGAGSFDPEHDRQIVLAWKAPKDVTGDVKLRAFSLKPRTYFRMDTAKPAGGGSYDWPSDFLASADLGGKDVGVLAWLTLPGPAGRNREIYLPIRAKSTKLSDDYELTLVPSKKLKKVLISLSQTNEQGGVSKVVFSNKEVGGEFPYFPSNEPTVISTGKIESAGYYHLEIKATAASGDSVISEIDFYHSAD